MGNIGGGGDGALVLVLVITSVALLLSSTVTSLAYLSSCLGRQNDRDNSAAVSAFVAANHVNVANDIARGRGETIDTISEMAGCEDVEHVALSLQANFRFIFPAHPNDNYAHERAGVNVVAVLRTENGPTCDHL